MAGDFVERFSSVSGLSVAYILEVFEQLARPEKAKWVDHSCFYVVEIPHQRPPSAWWANDEKDFIRRVTDAYSRSRSGSVLYEVTSPLSVALAVAQEEGRFYVERQSGQLIGDDDVACWVYNHQDSQSVSADAVTADDILDHEAPGAVPARLFDGSHYFLDSASIQVICKDRWPEIYALAERIGWDSPIYRCDYVSEEYQSEPITELEACSAYVAHDLYSCRIYRGAPAAIAGLDEISGHGSSGATYELRKLLQEMGDLPTEDDDKDN